MDYAVLVALIVAILSPWLSNYYEKKRERERKALELKLNTYTELLSAISELEVSGSGKREVTLRLTTAKSRLVVFGSEPVNKLYSQITDLSKPEHQKLMLDLINQMRLENNKDKPLSASVATHLLPRLVE